jgi:glycopeptide antibiotics resistance protein
MQDLDKSTSKTDNKISKSSLIFIAGVANIIPFMIILDMIAKNAYDIKVLSNIQVKI